MLLDKDGHPIKKQIGFHNDYIKEQDKDILTNVKAQGERVFTYRSRSGNSTDIFYKDEDRK